MPGQGTVTLDFGAFPGASDALVAVTGQVGILASSLVEAWILPADTPDHTADEHWVESLRVVAGNIVAGTGFTVYGLNTGELSEQFTASERQQFAPTAAAQPGTARSQARVERSGLGTRIWGRWNVAWAWN